MPTGLVGSMAHLSVPGPCWLVLILDSGTHWPGSPAGCNWPTLPLKKVNTSQQHIQGVKGEHRGRGHPHGSKDRVAVDQEVEDGSSSELGSEPQAIHTHPNNPWSSTRRGGSTNPRVPKPSRKAIKATTIRTASNPTADKVPLVDISVYC
ncbi:hypothetical protein DSO57_1021987 [Entomophthora muscae]|uniref:Uncharacterized protein n=1 Tax=Entomophthora muscae TaxID=34485 RepID=A0ACC2T3B0_9FUNG|nr:hypothetical protein DSO57_1021987 [Entomophthora muscae]